MDKILFNKTLIYSHNTGGEGNYDDELFSYFLDNKVSEIIKIDFPFGEKSLKTIRFKQYKSQKEYTKFESKIKFSTPTLGSYLKDVIMGFYYGIKFGKNTDLFIGMDNLLVLVGLILKKFGIVKQVYYVVIDYTPRRYSNNLLNKIYYSLDKIALYNSDLVLGLNNIMVEQRIKDHNLDESKINYKVAPFGNHSSKRIKSDYKNNRNNLVYFGGIMKSKGCELFVPIMQALQDKGFDEIKFHIIGGGDTDWLQDQVKQANLEDFIKIYGRIEKTEDIDKILLSSGIAIAPYYPEDKNNFSYYADPGKVKIYLGCGLPIIITDVPPISKDIQSSTAGLITEYKADKFADSIIEVYNSYDKYSKNAIIMGKQFDWKIILDKVFKL